MSIRGLQLVELPYQRSVSKHAQPSSKGSSSPSSQPLVIGWRERVDLPDWGISGLLAKADTGAKSSAIDVQSLSVQPDDTVCFEVALSKKNRKRTESITAPIHRRVKIRSSNGQSAERILVLATIQIGRVQKTVEVGLVSRRTMICRLLLGRTALGNDFLVDPTNTYLFGKPS